MTTQVKMIIGVIVAIIVIAAGAMFLLPKNSTAPTEDASDIQSQEDSSGGSMTKGSVKSLMGAGKNITCKMTYPDGGGSGTVYVSDKKVRGTFTLVSNGQTMESEMLQDGEYGYFWTGAQGTKFKVDATLPTPTPGSNTKNDDLDKEVDLDCSSWSVDNSKFTVPTDVKFTEISASMMQAPVQSQQMQQNQQSVCNQITDPQDKAACISAMSGQ